MQRALIMERDEVGTAPRAGAMVLGDLTLVRPLALAGIESVVATYDPAEVTLSSRHVQRGLLLPPLSGPTEAHALKALCRAGDALAARAHPRPLLVYGSDEFLSFDDRHREVLDRSFAMLLSSPELTRTALDKQRFGRFARRQGIEVPDALEDHEPLVAARRLGHEVVVKPRDKGRLPAGLRAVLGDGKAAVVSVDHLLTDRNLYGERASLVVQRRLACAPEDLVSFHGFVARDGGLLASFVGRKLRTYPAVGGDSARIEILDDPRLAREATAILERLGVRGPFKLDLVRDRATGRLVTLEVNLRYNLWHHLGAVNGVNLLLVAHRHLVCGESVPAMTPTTRYRWIDIDRGDRSSRAEGVSIPAWLGSLAERRNVYEVFAWDDPLPAARWFGDVLRRKVRAWRASA
ncbi:MAG: hypothetical protein FJ096_05755 [Deltaproteobacteria bacterium]|nr:hypothetical protein [Deltaproteobacteria bacterium]